MTAIRPIIIAAAALAPAAASAHPGHLAEVAGHGHWLGAAAIGAAIAIGLWQALKERPRKAEDDEADASEEPQEA